MTYATQAAQTEEPAHVCYALTVIGMAQHALGHLENAGQTLNHALEQARAIGDLYAEAAALRALSELHVTRQNSVDALQMLEQSREIYRQLGNAMEAKAVEARLEELTHLASD